MFSHDEQECGGKETTANSMTQIRYNMEQERL